MCNFCRGVGRLSHRGVTTALPRHPGSSDSVRELSPNSLHQPRRSSSRKEVCPVIGVEENDSERTLQEEIFLVRKLATSDASS
ncbi:hypothetical protein AVEN_86333-1 [Araneus ventricosus]|uniref:Uncharacterized protein n=1 Tax=Araneus ventricosus TaxID=182803 RepID=A0A4Y2GBB1_ARAVE|nr:hypothetical protein AVEN_86333-1 [Araneus ventricosus]